MSLGLALTIVYFLVIKCKSRSLQSKLTIYCITGLHESSDRAALFSRKTVSYFFLLGREN